MHGCDVPFSDLPNAEELKPPKMTEPPHPIPPAVTLPSPHLPGAQGVILTVSHALHKVLEGLSKLGRL